MERAHCRNLPTLRNPPSGAWLGRPAHEEQTGQMPMPQISLTKTRALWITFAPMKFLPAFVITTSLLLSAGRAELSPEDQAKLPAAAGRTVDFGKDIQPLFEAACVKCHA